MSKRKSKLWWKLKKIEKKLKRGEPVPKYFLDLRLFYENKTTTFGWGAHAKKFKNLEK